MPPLTSLLMRAVEVPEGTALWAAVSAGAGYRVGAVGNMGVVELDSTLGLWVADWMAV
jgi:hypothetical protein